MNLFENAEKFFHKCESLAGWDACKDFVAEGAEFTAQCEPLTEIKTVQGYVEWLAGLGATALPGCSYEKHVGAFDETQETALFFATFTATHTGEGGPVPPTHKRTSSHYVYAIRMNDDGKVVGMTKIWNAPWAMRELGWM